MGKKSTPEAPPPPDYAAAATAQGQANIEAAKIGAELARTNQYGPYGSQVFEQIPGGNQWQSTTTFSPEQQRLYDLQTQGQTALGETAVGQLDRIRNIFGQDFDLSQIPDRISSITGPEYAMYDTGQDFGTQKQEVEDALYRQATNRLDPEFAKQFDQERTRLINSGVGEGTEAYRNAMDAYERSKTAAYGDARDRSILAGGAEQSRLIGDTLRQLGFNNQAEAQQFIDALTSGGFQNKARASAIDEQAYMRSLPLNEYNALMTGAQVTNPQFAATQAVQGPAPAPTFAATQAADQRAIDLYNAQLASSGSAQGGLFGALGTLGGAALSNPAIFSSDRRLKTDIVQIGHIKETGLPIYQYKINGEEQIGVMSDEVVHVHPEAVLVGADGFDRVDYSKVFGTPVYA